MSNSPLVTYSQISPKKTSPRNHAIDTITIHCIVGQWTAKQGCDYFATTDRDCSVNYVVGKDGSIGLSVDEKDRSWCSSNSANDNRAITIEVASDTKHPYSVTDAAFAALLDLVEDICRRNGIKKLLWKADKSLIGKVDQQNMTVHRWFANKACPGDYLYSRHGEIAAEVNKRLAGGATGGVSGGGEGNNTPKPENTPQATTGGAEGKPSTGSKADEKTIWDFLLGKIGNEYGVAGLMGNLYAESGLKSSNLQNSYEKKLGFTDSTYAAAVDSGAYSNFVNDKAGFGLAQWTYWSRKQALLQYAQGKGKSIGDLTTQLEFLIKELTESYPSVLRILKNGKSVRETSDAVLLKYERPANQGESVQKKRAEYGQKYYTAYAKTGAPAPETGLTVGMEVDFTGTKNYTSSYAKATAKTCKPCKATITDISPGQAHPYHCVGPSVHGWVDAADVSPIAEKIIRKGDKVKVLKAKTYKGGTFRTYYDTYDVISVNGDRVVIGIGKTVTAAVHKDNLQPV